MTINANSIAPNQTEVTTGERVLFFSYKTLVAARIGGTIYITSQVYSKTTTKHVNLWLDRQDQSLEIKAVSQAALEALAEGGQK